MTNSKCTKISQKINVQFWLTKNGLTNILAVKKWYSTDKNREKYISKYSKQTYAYISLQYKVNTYKSEQKSSIKGRVHQMCIFDKYFLSWTFSWSRSEVFFIFRVPSPMLWILLRAQRVNKKCTIGNTSILRKWL